MTCLASDKSNMLRVAYNTNVKKQYICCLARGIGPCFVQQSEMQSHSSKQLSEPCNLFWTLTCTVDVTDLREDRWTKEPLIKQEIPVERHALFSGYHGSPCKSMQEFKPWHKQADFIEHSSRHNKHWLDLNTQAAFLLTSNSQTC